MQPDYFTFCGHSHFSSLFSLLRWRGGGIFFPLSTKMSASLIEGSLPHETAGPVCCWRCLEAACPAPHRAAGQCTPGDSHAVSITIPHSYPLYLSLGLAPLALQPDWTWYDSEGRSSVCTFSITCRCKKCVSSIFTPLLLLRAFSGGDPHLALGIL